jgi:uncharacterized protein YdaU (DUF1376 family)
MNWYEHHLGDWAKKCGHLSFAEEGAYRRMLDWYYAHELPLPLDQGALFRALRVSRPCDKRVVTRVLAEFFERHLDGYHQSRADKDIARFVSRRPQSEESTLAATLRKQRSRARRSHVFELLAAHGIVPAYNATNEELRGLCDTVGVKWPMHADAAVTLRVTRDNKRDAEPVTLNGHDSQSPTTKNQEEGAARALVVTAAEAAATAARATLACKAMKAAGFADVRPADPRLHALLVEGSDDSELTTVAAEASTRSKSWSWLLATVDGRRKDAAANPLGASRSHDAAFIKGLMTHATPSAAAPSADDARQVNVDARGTGT